MEVGVQFHAPAALPPGKSPCYPLDIRLGGPQRRSGRSGDQINSKPLPGLESPIIKSVAQLYTAELSRLLILPCYPVIYIAETPFIGCFSCLQMAGQASFTDLIKQHVYPVNKCWILGEISRTWHPRS